MKKTTGIEMSPGYTIKRELKARDMKQVELARRTGIRPSHLSEMIKGTRAVNKLAADKLEEVLGIPAVVWLTMQISYEQRLKELEQMSIEECDAEFAYKDYDDIIDMKLLMKEFGQDYYDIVTQIEFCKNTLHFGTPAEMCHRCGAFHKSDKTGLDKRMISTWAILAKFYANEQNVQGTFNKEDSNKLSKELSSIFHANDDTEKKVKDLLSQYGIRFAIVPKLEKASIDGYAFFCEDGVPAIVVTKRIPRIDNFAFSVLHEVGHLVLHDVLNNPSVSLDSDEEDVMEIEANKYAADALIPYALWNEAPETIMNPFIIQKEYSKWADERGLNKWIVLGRISHETGMYKFKTDQTREIN